LIDDADINVKEEVHATEQDILSISKVTGLNPEQIKRSIERGEEE
jgi:hypothetical protein